MGKQDKANKPKKPRKLVSFRRGRKKFVSYERASKMVQLAGVKTFTQWVDYCHGTGDFEHNRKPGYIPANPNLYYGPEGTGEWEDWGTFLDTGNIANNKKRRDFVTYETAREFCHSLNIRSIKEWREMAESDFARPSNIPSAPNIIYKDSGWTSWSDFLLPKFLSYTSAKNLISTIKPKIKTSKAWREFASSENRPRNIPANPERYYKDSGWKGWPDFLGTKRASRRLTYEESKKVIFKLNLKNRKDFEDWVSSDEYLPAVPEDPQKVYKDKGWVSWNDFLGVDAAKRIVDFKEAKAIAENLGPKIAAQWHSLVKAVRVVQENNKRNDIRPDVLSDKLPDNPRDFYKSQGWVSWADFLLKDEEYPSFQIYRRQKTLIKNERDEILMLRDVNYYLDEVVGHKEQYVQMLNSLGDKANGQRDIKALKKLLARYSVKSLDDWRALTTTIYSSDMDGKKGYMKLFFHDIDLNIEEYYSF